MDVQDRRQGLNRLTVGVFALLFVGGSVLYALAVSAMSPGWMRELIAGLALSISTAGGVGVAIEVFAARQLIDHTSREIAARVMARHLPSGFERRISEIVHGTSVVLEDLVTSYTLTKTETGQADVVIDQTYTARNYGQTTEPYQPMNAEEGMYDPRYEILEVVHKSAQKQHTISTSKRWTGAIECVGPKVRLARHGSAGDSCSVHWRFRLTMPPDYSHVLAFGTPTVNPTIRVLSAAGFEFFADKTDTDEHTATTWKYGRAYLPGHHLRVWWTAK